MLELVGNENIRGEKMKHSKTTNLARAAHRTTIHVARNNNTNCIQTQTIFNIIKIIKSV